jgi:erythromycin esterase-like protein
MKLSRSVVCVAAVLPFLMGVVAPVQGQELGPAAALAALDTAREAARQPAPAGYPVQPGIWRLNGIDPNLPDEDLEPLRRRVGRATVVGLGESFHTVGDFYILKHRIFRYLVEKAGFRVFAIESNWTGADLAAEYVQTCAGTPRDALLRHISVWQGTELADLIQWMCEWNREHPNPADRVHYFGFDIQQPEDDGPALVAFLERIGIGGTGQDHPWVAGIRSCDRVTVRYPFREIPQEVHDRCVQALDEMEAYLQRNRRTLLRQMSAQDFEIAKLQVVGLRAWQLQTFLIGHDFAAGYSARDVGMAYAFLTLRGLRFPKAKTVVWAANSHISRTGLPDGTRPMGSHLAAALGRNYVNFAITAYETRVHGSNSCRTVAAPEGSVEERFHDLGEEALFVDLAFPGTRNPFLARGRYPMGWDTVEPHRNYTGLLFLEHAEAMNPLTWPACQ